MSLTKMIRITSKGMKLNIFAYFWLFIFKLIFFVISFKISTVA